MQARAGDMLKRVRLRLNESLFPAAPRSDGESRLGRGELAVVGLALLALAIVLQILRIGPTAALDSLWAEDGQIFLQGAITQSFWHTIFSTYAGYLVFVPRLIGEVGSAVPLRDAAAAISIASTVVVALCGLAVWHTSTAHIRNPYLRGTLAALTILAPVAGLESIASAAYVPWYMLFATFWLLLWKPRTTWGAALGALLILATGLSSPGVWFFAPLALLRAVAVRDRRDLMIVGSWAIGALVQVPVILLNTEEKVTPLWTSDIWTTYIQRVIDGGALGDRVGGIAWVAIGWPLLIALLAGIVAGLVLGLRRSTPAVRYLAAIAIPTSLVMFVVSVYQRALGTLMMWPADDHSGAGGRYVIVPALLLVSVALVMIDRWPRPLPGPRRLSWLGLAATLILLAGLLTSFYVREPESRGTPTWSEALDAGAVTCRAEQLEVTTIPISPPGFGVVVSCDDLR